MAEGPDRKATTPVCHPATPARDTRHAAVSLSRDGDGAGELVRARSGHGLRHRDTAGHVL